MYIKSKNDKDTIVVSIPLTTQTEKTRIKRRSILNQYGLPVATRSENITQDCYVEWQIGYDVVVSETEKLAKTTLKNYRFEGANGKEKALYELSEYVYYFLKWGIINKKELLELKSKLLNIKDDNLFDSESMLSIKRSHFIEKELNNTKFLFSKVEYPLLVYKFDPYEIITEIIIREKQYAIGVQPMLYLCFPVTELRTTISLIGRPAEKKEEAEFMLNKSNFGILIKLLHLFGMLSINHRKDIVSIIDVCISNV